MVFAGSVNISMLLLAVSALQRSANTESFSGTFVALSDNTGNLVAILFALGLLVSGLASTSVASQAGSVIMQGLLKRKINVFVRRTITIIPAFLILIFSLDPTRALIISQVGLSFGIPFALIPLAMVTASKTIMGPGVNNRTTTILVSLIAGAVTVLNAVLIWLTVSG